MLCRSPAHYIFVDSGCSEAYSSIRGPMDKLVINGRNCDRGIDFPDLSLCRSLARSYGYDRAR
jgi:hypothetical protein